MDQELKLSRRDEPPPLSVRILGIAWPAFVAASALEMLVFALVDPQDLHWGGQALAVSRQTVYTVSFFAFWAIVAAACATATLLARQAGPREDGD